MEPTTFTTAEACALTGVDSRRLTEWIGRGLIPGQKPKRQGSPGKEQRRYTFAQIDRIRELKAQGRKRSKRTPTPSPEGLLSTQEVCDLTGATYRQVTYWVDRGYVKAERRKPPGVKIAFFFDQIAVERIQRLKAASDERRKRLDEQVAS